MVLSLKNWGLAPLTKEATIIYRSTAEKLLAATVEERRRLEPELMPYLRVADQENPFMRGSATCGSQRLRAVIGKLNTLHRASLPMFDTTFISTIEIGRYTSSRWDCWSKCHGLSVPQSSA